MAAFFPGAGRPETLTPTQREMYLSQLGEVLFLRDRAMLLYHFGKLGDEGVESLLIKKSDPKAARRALAWEMFISGYNQRRQMEPETARDFMAALRANRMPAWVLNIVPFEEIRSLVGSGNT